MGNFVGLDALEEFVLSRIEPFVVKHSAPDGFLLKFEYTGTQFGILGWNHLAHAAGLENQEDGVPQTPHYHPGPLLA